MEIIKLYDLVKKLLQEKEELRGDDDLLYLTVIKIVHPYCNNARINTKKPYLWRLRPIDARAETRAPAQPTNLTIQQQADGLNISWTAPEDDDPLTYLVLRAEQPSTEEAEYNTIARGISTTSFLDTTAEEGKNYSYKIKAVDYAGNRSKASEELATGIESVVTDNGTATTDNGRWYDMSGKPASETTSGIILQGKKKVYRK